MGARRTSQSTSTASASSTAPTCIEHADPRQGFHPDWKSFVFNYDRFEVRSFLLSSAHYWLDEFHVDGLRVDAVASMLYLDYSREEGEWIPNRDGGKENLGAVEFLQELNRSIYDAFPGFDHGRRGVDRVAGRDEPDGLPMASGSVSSGTWAGCTTRSNT